MCIRTVVGRLSSVVGKSSRWSLAKALVVAIPLSMRGSRSGRQAPKRVVKKSFCSYQARLQACRGAEYKKTALAAVFAIRCALRTGVPRYEVRSKPECKVGLASWCAPGWLVGNEQGASEKRRGPADGASALRE